MGKRRSITAGELMRQLEADPQWIAKRDARETRYAERAKLVEVDQASIVADLKTVGVSVSSVYDLVGIRDVPIAAFPILVRHLDEEHLPVVREGVIRALGLPSAKDVAFGPLCVAFSRERNQALRWVIANALSGMARLEELGDLPGINEYSSLFA